MNLSENEMLALWRQVMNIDVNRTNCQVEVDDGIEIDALLRTHIKQWYDNLLETAPLQWLPQTDVASQAVATANSEGVVNIELPNGCVRLSQLMLQGWQQPVTQFHQPDDDVALMQTSPYLRGALCNPVAVLYEQSVMAYSIEPGTQPVVTQLLAVMRNDAGKYVFSRSAIATIPQFGAWMQ